MNYLYKYYIIRQYDVIFSMIHFVYKLNREKGYFEIRMEKAGEEFIFTEREA